MRIYFSGGTGKLSAEFLIPERKPHVMLTYIEAYEHRKWSGWAYDRLRQHVLRKRGKGKHHKVNAFRAQRAIKKDRLPNTIMKKKDGLLNT